MGTKKLLENDQVIVSEIVLVPGESTGVHRHEFDYVVYVITGATLKATDGNGDNATEVSLSAGDTYHFQIRGEHAISGELETTAVHSAENLSSETYRELMVELK